MKKRGYKEVVELINGIKSCSRKGKDKNDTEAQGCAFAFTRTSGCDCETRTKLCDIFGQREE